jgi:hypothetical protein
MSYRRGTRPAGPLLCHPGEVPFPRPRRLDAEGRFIVRPWTGIAACAIWAVFGGLWLLAAVGSGWPAVLRQAPVVALISTVVYAIFGRPRVIVARDDVLLRNVVRDVSIPYSAISGIDTQYALTVTTVDGRRHQAWAAPAGGRIRATRVTEEERKALTWTGPLDEIPSSAGLRSDAGAAAVAIRRKWRPSTGDEPTAAGAAPARGVEIRWATGVLVTFAVCLVGTLVAGLS